MSAIRNAADLDPAQAEQVCREMVTHRPHRLIMLSALAEAFTADELDDPRAGIAANRVRRAIRALRGRA